MSGGGKTILHSMMQGHIARGAMKVALVVGTVLNVINNGEQLWTDHTVNGWHFAMNYFVPFCVSSYSAARNEASRSRGA